jgi:hypothetical protein
LIRLGGKRGHVKPEVSRHIVALRMFAICFSQFFFRMKPFKRIISSFGVDNYSLLYHPRSQRHSAVLSTINNQLSLPTSSRLTLQAVQGLRLPIMNPSELKDVLHRAVSDIEDHSENPHSSDWKPRTSGKPLREHESHHAAKDDCVGGPR